MKVHEALQEYFKDKQISQVAIAEALGVTKAYVNALLSGRQNFGKRQAEIWSEKFGLNKAWLLTGEGEMIADNDEPERGIIEMQTRDEIPLIPASAFAGSVKGFAPDSITLQKCEWVKPPMQGAQYAIPITGDSMEPVFANGSIAYIRQINEAAFLPWGNAVILDTENGAFLKVIYPDEQDKEYIWAKSYNPNYPPLHIPTASVFRIFRVLGTSKIFTTM